MSYKITQERKKNNTAISAVLAKRQMSPSDLARKSDLEKAQIYNIVNGIQTDMLLSTAKKIANALGESLDTCFGDGDMGMKNKLLKYIEQQESKLHKMDAEGHIWWNKFKEVLKEL